MDLELSLIHICLCLLEKVARRVDAAGFTVSNIDGTIVAQAPKLADYFPQMCQNIAAACLSLIHI